MITVLRNLNLVDVVNTVICKNMDITVAGERIHSISPTQDIAAYEDAEVIELGGCYAMPGLIDLHTHLIWSGGSDPARTVEEEGSQLSLLHAAGNASQTLQAGITCVRDVGSNENATLALAKAVDKGYLPGPRIISCGCTITMTGGHDPFWAEQADGPLELLKAVRRQVMKGAKVIKISATGGVYGRSDGEDVGTTELSGEEIKIICEEAHRFELKVAAHAISKEGIWNCVKNGVDTIEHGHFLTSEAMIRMKEQSMTWVPTLYVYRKIAEGEGLPPYAVSKARLITDIHRKAFVAALSCGISIGCGSDAGSPNTPHGSLFSELDCMVEYGCPTGTALQAATIVAAQALGMVQELGSLETGKKADILILKGNPIEDIGNLRHLDHVIKDGKFISRYSARDIEQSLQE